MIRAKNIVVLSGIITKISKKDRISVIHIANDGGREKAYPYIVFKDNSLSGFEQGDRVMLTAHLQDRRTKKVDQKPEYYQEIAGDTIKRAERMLHEFFDKNVIPEEDGGIAPRDTNYGIIVGEITHLYSPKAGTVILTISVPDGPVMNNCEVICYRRQAEKAESYQEGDYVAVAGCIQTSLKSDGAGLFQSFVCRDIEIIE